MSIQMNADSADVPVIGIVGGVGAGKSSIVRAVRSLKLDIIDADAVGHRQLNAPEVRNQLVAQFGDGILNSEGIVNRPVLAEIVFGDAEDQIEKRARLNAIVHPRIRHEIQKQIRNTPEETDIIVLDAALLLESGWADECDVLIFVDTPLADRRRRVRETRGWTSEEHRRREASQWDIDRKRQHCRYVVDNSGTPEDAVRQMEDILHKVLSG